MTDAFERGKKNRMTYENMLGKRRVELCRVGCGGVSIQSRGVKMNIHAFHDSFRISVLIFNTYLLERGEKYIISVN